LLPTGGGRCNLAHAEYDFKELAKNYPRGEKFLYSVFSKFSTSDTIDFFEKIGIDVYTQNDNRIFPTSNSSAEVRDKMLKTLSKCNLVKEEVNKIESLPNGWKIKTNKCLYAFDYVIVAIGGHASFDILKDLNIKIQPPTQALVGLTTQEDFSEIAGVSIKDILFTHKGVSGPAIYKISSIRAREKFPYKLTLNIIDDFELQPLLDTNPHKEVKNLLGQIIPKSLALWVLNNLKINPETPCHKINGKTRDRILNKITNFEVTVTGKVQDGEVVTCGGVDLKEVNAKTLESRQYSRLYFCGEILDIDGFCGGFNLQNCWSTGYIVSQSIIMSS
ncbi:MAG: aminoacetone oxidase family FAD-binding enzyme, partial [Candidatus Gastranaerophilales bacterium]|nr:aminoacetone oxidase family FAD-binding enzyme [Candidatus Gastranaerophilales bacterium]